MSHEITQAFVIAWLLVFIPLGMLGFGLWGLWRLIPRLRRSWGYSNRVLPISKHPSSK